MTGKHRDEAWIVPVFAVIAAVTVVGGFLLIVTQASAVM